MRRECEETRGGEKKVAQLDPGPGLPRRYYCQFYNTSGLVAITVYTTTTGRRHNAPSTPLRASSSSPGAPLMLLLPNGDGRQPALRGWRERAAAEAPVGPCLGRGVRFGAISHRVSKGWSKLVGALACARAGARVHVLLHHVDLGFFSGHWNLPQRRTAVNRQLPTRTLEPRGGNWTRLP